MQLPGHSTRIGEPVATSLQRLVSDALVGLTPELTIPFVFFGHSLGALIAYELTHELSRAGATGPAHLIVAGRGAPSIARAGGPIHTLPDGEFIGALQTKYNAIPSEVLREPELLQLLLPALRADFRLHETYVYRAPPPLSCGLSVYGGSCDESVTEPDLLAWQAETKKVFSKKMIAGNHFFIHSSRPKFMNALRSELEEIISLI